MSVTKKLLLVVCAVLSPTLLANSHQSSLPKVPCGVERWPVKTLTDLDRGKVSFTPVQTTVAKLTALPRHRVPYPQDRRVAPEELTTYRMRAKLIVGLGHESDSDIHLFLVDPDHPQELMIAEIPAPECAKGSGHEEEFRKARSLVQSLRVGTMIEVTGVGFFDSVLDPSVGAKNGIELHPLLKVVTIPQR